MVANNFVEIYTLMFGWGMYGAIWDILTGSGIALVPFIAAIITSVSDGLTQGGTAQDVLSNIEMKVISTILVLMLCVIPFTGWGTTLATTQYEIAVNDCHPPSNLSGTGDDTDTGFDDTFSGMSSLEIYKPVAWSLVTLISSAVTNTAIKSMQCVNNYEFLLMRMSNIKVQDSNLRERIGDFYEQCFLVAHARHKAIGGAVPSDVSEMSDIDWIGSRIFVGLADSGEYYDHEEAFMENMQKYGFSRQTDLRASDTARESGAHPYCREVWLGEAGTGDAKGLRELILNDIPEDDAGNVMDDWMTWGYKVLRTDDPEVWVKEDLFIKTILQAEAANLGSKTNVNLSGTFDANRQTGKAFYDWFVGTVGNLMGAKEYLSATAIRQNIKTAGPIVLALMQMVIILASPIVMVLGNYSFTTFSALGLSYFGLEFINAIWAIAYWMDNNLLAHFTNHTGFWTLDTSSVVLTFVTGMSVVFLPAVWLSILAYAATGMLRGMGHAGVGGGQALGSNSFQGSFSGARKLWQKKDK